jgi:hypothetical protein
MRFQVVARLWCQACMLVSGAFVLTVSSGCWSPEVPLVSSEPVAISYSLYLGRGSLSSNDFEQYRSLPEGLFAECGTVHRGRSHTAYQGIEPLSAATAVGISATALEIIEQMKSEEPPRFDASGAGSGFADPGKFILLLGSEGARYEVRTSLDWVERQQTPFAKRLNTLGRLIRGVPERAPCGNGEFYGLSRE